MKSQVRLEPLVLLEDNHDGFSKPTDKTSKNETALAKKKSTTKPTKKQTAKEIPFEESLEQLREVVNQLENGNLTLSQSLEEYEQGVSSLKSCYEALNLAQRRIEMLVELDEEGNLVTRPFDNTASTEMADGSRRAVGSQDKDEFEEEDDPDEDELDMDDPDSLF